MSTPPFDDRSPEHRLKAIRAMEQARVECAIESPQMDPIVPNFERRFLKFALPPTAEELAAEERGP